MQVMCINATSSPLSVNYPNVDLIEGNIYTVIKEVLATCSNGELQPAYKLLELHPENGAYAKWRFIAISDIDETELVNETAFIKR